MIIVFVLLESLSDCRSLVIMNVIVLSTVALGFAGEILVGHMVGAGQLRASLHLVRKTLAPIVGTQ